MVVVNVKLTFAVKFVTAIWNLSLALTPATCPVFAILLKAPFNHVAPAVTYLCTKKNKISNMHEKEAQIRKHIQVYKKKKTNKLCCPEP